MENKLNDNVSNMLKIFYNTEENIYLLVQHIISIGLHEHQGKTLFAAMHSEHSL